METKKGVKRFTKGINRDISKSLINAESSYFIRNYKLNTDKGLSTGSLVSESGNTLMFNVPDIPQMVLSNGTIIPSQNNLTIIGSCIMDTDDIILFTTNNNSYGQIWLLEFDPLNDTIIGLIGNDLDPSIHLKYNNILNFNTANRIKAVARYETQTKKRIYWTDNINNVRSFNVADPNSLILEPSNLDLKADVSMSQPSILSRGNGSLQTGTMIQVGYRLLDTNGADTIYSPLSELYPIPKSNPTTTTYNDIKGDGDPTLVADNLASVSYILKGLDTNYNFIEHIIVIYTAPNVYTIYKFDEESIPSNGELVVTCSSITNSITIDPTELNILSSGFDIAKDIEIKDNRLIAANTKSYSFDVNFDTRAYRFDNSQEAIVYNSNDELDFRVIDGTNPVYTIVEDTFDAVNHYNSEGRSDWFSKQYKYQLDGSTIGGSGQNISYRFITHEMPANFNGSITVNAPHLDVSPRWNTNTIDSTLGVIERDGTTRNIVRVNNFKNNNSAYNPTYFKGYSRGEVYRFGIVFYNKKNQPSFVKWIGDIKFPEPEDGFPIQDLIGSIPYLYSLGIEFTIDITDIESQISGYQIVRVERLTEDKTRLGTGILMSIEEESSGTENLIYQWETDSDGGLDFGGGAITNLSFEYGASLPYGYSQYHLADYPGRSTVAVDKVRRLKTIVSPMNQEYEVLFQGGDYTKTTGYYTGIPTKYHHFNGAGLGDDNDNYGFYYKLNNYEAINHDDEIFEIDNQKIFRVGELIPNGDSFLNGLTGSVRNTSYCRSADYTGLTPYYIPLGLGSQKMIIVYKESPSITHNSGDIATNEDWYNVDDYKTSNTFVGDIGDTIYFKEVSYCRYLNNQYNGDDFESRSTNQYIATNHYQPIEVGVTSTTNTVDVYGGDVFVNYFDDEYIQQYHTRDIAYKDPYNEPRKNQLSVAICCPVESPINTDFITGNRWASNRNSSSMTAYESNDYTYNNVWSQENNTEEKFFAQDFLIELDNEHRHRIWASEVKSDGELIDSWRQFKVANSIEVNGVHGGINRLITFRDQLFFYQDKAMGIASIDKEALITDEFGTQLSLGEGRVIDYGYISQNTGCFHQWGVISSEYGIYHFDVRLKKLFKYSQEGLTALSDIKGFGSYFNENINGNILSNDKTIEGIGIETTWDNKNNRVLFTLLDHKKLLGVPIANEPIEYNEGDILFINGDYYYIEDYQSHFYSDSIGFDISDLNVSSLNNYIHGVTFSYNESFDCLESFYDYKPSLYINNGRSLLSINPFNNKEGYVHNKGNNFSQYYGFNYPMEVETILTGDLYGYTNIFNNIEYQDEVFNKYQKDLFLVSFQKYKARNDYQNTGIVTLNNSNYKKRMRLNHLTLGRDQIDKQSRLRSPWLRFKLILDNHQGEYRHIVHNIMYNYIPSNY